METTTTAASTRQTPSETSSRSERPQRPSVSHALAFKYKAEGIKAVSEAVANCMLVALYAAGAYAVLELVKAIRSLM